MALEELRAGWPAGVKVHLRERGSRQRRGGGRWPCGPAGAAAASARISSSGAATWLLREEAGRPGALCARAEPARRGVRTRPRVQRLNWRTRSARTTRSSFACGSRSGTRTGHQVSELHRGVPASQPRPADRSRSRRWRAPGVRRACGGPGTRRTVSRTEPIQGPHGAGPPSRRGPEPEEATPRNAKNGAAQLPFSPASPARRGSCRRRASTRSPRSSRRPDSPTA